jgi:LPS export ABC transporter protein LptC
LSALSWQRLVPLLLVPALGGLFYTLQRMDDSGGGSGAEPVSQLPRYTLTTAELTRYDADGNANLFGTADSVEYFDDQSGRAHNLAVDLVASDDKTWHVTSPSATLPAHQRRFMLDGPVVATGHWPDSGEAVTVHTDRLWIEPELHQIQTDAPVHLQSPSRTGDAVGMRSDWSARRLQLLHNVNMTYQQAKMKHEAAR